MDIQSTALLIIGLSLLLISSFSYSKFRYKGLFVLGILGIVLILIGVILIITGVK